MIILLKLMKKLINYKYIFKNAFKLFQFFLIQIFIYMFKRKKICTLKGQKHHR